MFKLLGALAGGRGAVKGGEGRRGAGGGGGVGEAGRGWAVVKARATPGNPASIIYRIFKLFFNEIRIPNKIDGLGRI